MDKAIGLIVLVVVLCCVGSCDRSCTRFAMNATPSPMAMICNDKLEGPGEDQYIRNRDHRRLGDGLGLGEPGPLVAVRW